MSAWKTVIFPERKHSPIILLPPPPPPPLIRVPSVCTLHPVGYLTHCISLLTPPASGGGGGFTLSICSEIFDSKSNPSYLSELSRGIFYSFLGRRATEISQLNDLQELFIRCPTRSFTPFPPCCCFPFDSRSFFASIACAQGGEWRLGAFQGCTESSSFLGF